LIAIDIPERIGALEPDLVERFQADLVAVWDGKGKLGVAVSGGPDSLALLLLADALMPGRVEAATVDHALRAQSAQEAAYVAKVCAARSIPHETLNVEVQPGNLQAKAREARYAALSSWMVRRGLAALATAHHADDQAETLLMRLNRGSGLSGLAGVRARSWGHSTNPPGEFELVRPLLAWRKSELTDLLNDMEIDAVQDSSNSDEDFDRVRIRKALAEQDWLDPMAVAKSARLLGEMLHDVDRTLAAQRNRLVHELDDGIVYLWGNGDAFEVENVHWIVERLGGSAQRSQIATMIERLRNKQNASLGGVLARSIMFEITPNTSSAAWRFEPEPPRKTG